MKRALRDAPHSTSVKLRILPIIAQMSCCNHGLRINFRGKLNAVEQPNLCISNRSASRDLWHSEPPPLFYQQLIGQIHVPKLEQRSNQHQLIRIRISARAMFPLILARHQSALFFGHVRQAGLGAVP
jgi:hypothetical protein